MKINNKTIRSILNIKTREELVENAISNIINQVTSESSGFSELEQTSIVSGIKIQFIGILEEKVAKAQITANHIKYLKDE